MSEILPPAILLMGPTASGKTDLAMQLAERLPVDLISVDSAMVYRGMDIGTAKPSPEELARCPHHLIDICDPADLYSAERFRVDALAAMAEITEAGRVPLLVGGTMLYFRALQYGLSPLPASDPVIRGRLESELAEYGLVALHARLRSVDSVIAQRVHPNDTQRTLRALEVFEITGRPLSTLQAERAGEAMPWRAIKLACAPTEREVLHKRIERRFHTMLEAGFEDEVCVLVAREDLYPELPSMRSVGYRQMWAWLRGEYEYEEMVRCTIAATRQLAKRQMTWLRSERGLLWLHETGDSLLDQAMNCIENTLK